MFRQKRMRFIATKQFAFAPSSRGTTIRWVHVAFRSTIETLERKEASQKCHPHFKRPLSCFERFPDHRNVICEAAHPCLGYLRKVPSRDTFVVSRCLEVDIESVDFSTPLTSGCVNQSCSALNLSFRELG